MDDLTEPVDLEPAILKITQISALVGIFHAKASLVLSSTGHTKEEKNQEVRRLLREFYEGARKVLPDLPPFEEAVTGGKHGE